MCNAGYYIIFSYLWFLVSQSTLYTYRLDAEALETKHYGEVSCREYRESILHNLPHQWSSRGDTKLVLSHFVKHKPGKGSKRKSLGERGGANSGVVSMPTTILQTSCSGL